ncbi:hypothetical protein WBO78_21905 [Bosea sp. CCNWLW174]|uniref:hypothetical protein n=1 Tax=unclassified Bosea (in: a-proteobacteria) TaxID=2653178 RepID=UPI003014E150
MNKIVREHYPVEKLPEDLRIAVGTATSVRLTIETPETSTDSCTRSALRRARELVRSGQIKRVTSQEAVDRIRKLRDEWPS